MLKQCWMFGYVQEFICDLLTLGLSSDVPVSTKHSAWVFLKSSCCAAMCWACCGSLTGLQADAQLLRRFVARDGLWMEECRARLGLSWTPRVSSNVTLLSACWTSKGGELGKLW